MAYVGNQPARGQWRKLTDISGSFNGVTTTFTTSVPPGTSEYYVTAGSASQLLISLGGVIQQPDTDYTVSTNSITFTTAPASGLSFFGVLCGDALNTGTPSDGSVTTSKLAGSLSVGLTGGSASTPSLYFTGDTNTGVYSPGADTLAFVEGGTEAMRIDSSGRVGIGTTSPSYTLDVNATGSTISSAFRTDQSENWVALKDSGTTIGHVRLGSTSGAMLFYAGNSERGRFDSSGRFLVGTSTARSNLYNTTYAPQIQLEGNDNANSSLSIISCFNGTSLAGQLILGKTNSGSVGANGIVANGNPIGRLSFQGNDGSEFVEAAAINCEVDGTPGANDMPGRLVFSTTADGAASSTERMRIGQNGQLDTYGTPVESAYTARVSYGSGTIYGFFSGRHSATNTSTGTNTFFVYTNGNVVNSNGSYGVLSDLKLKENIVDASSQWNDIKSVRVRKYNFKEETGQQTHTQIGVVAQELELVSPGLVIESPDRDEAGTDLGTVTKSVNQSVLYMKAVKALQEAMERIEALEAEVAALKAS